MQILPPQSSANYDFLAPMDFRISVRAGEKLVAMAGSIRTLRQPFSESHASRKGETRVRIETNSTRGTATSANWNQSSQMPLLAGGDGLNIRRCLKGVKSSLLSAAILAAEADRRSAITSRGITSGFLLASDRGLSVRFSGQDGRAPEDIRIPKLITCRVQREVSKKCNFKTNAQGSPGKQNAYNPGEP